MKTTQQEELSNYLSPRFEEQPIVTRGTYTITHFKQNNLYPLVPEYIPDIPDPPAVVEPWFSPPPQEAFNTTLDELEEVISDLFLTIRGMRSRNYDF